MMSLFIGGIRLEYTLSHDTVEHLLQLVVFMMSLLTHYICTVKREASLKALFKVNDDELSFQNAVELAQEIEEVTKVVRKPITLQRTADS